MLLLFSDGPVDVTISGSPSIEVGVKASFTCSATCSPACTYTWTVYGSPVKGSSIDITVSRYVATESISCQAQNSLSGKTATVNDTLTVSGGWSASRPLLRLSYGSTLTQYKGGLRTHYVLADSPCVHRKGLTFASRKV